MGLLGHDTSVLGWLVHAKGVTGAMLFLFLKDLEDSLRSKRLFSHHCVCKTQWFFMPAFSLCSFCIATKSHSDSHQAPAV